MPGLFLVQFFEKMNEILVQSLCKGTMRLAADYPVTPLQVPL
jgi:hypothetical protein